MNKLDLGYKIIDWANNNDITITNCNIIKVKANKINLYLTIKNEYDSEWAPKYKVCKVVGDVLPLWLDCKIKNVYIKSRNFNVGDTVEVDKLLIRLDAGEKETDIIKERNGCGQYRGGWVKGIVSDIERMVGVKFERDVWINPDGEYYSNVTELEKLIKEGKVKKIEVGQPLFIGSCSWELRKIRGESK